MIDTSNELRCKNPSCGNLVTQIRGHRRREYCSDTCKQTAYRLRKEQPHHDVTIVDESVQQRIAELEQELTQYRQLFDRAKLEARFMALGEQMQYHALIELGILGGSSYWREFLHRANDEALRRATAAAENYLEGLQALRGDPRELRIKELERQLDLEQRYQEDTRKRDFKIWLRNHPQPTDATFFKRFLDDRDLPTKASRSMYEAKLRSKNYDDVDILLFRDAWKRMLFNQL